MAKSKRPESRRILCTSCDLVLEVADVAKSVNCVHCNSRVITEPMKVDEYVAVRRFHTANRMRITRKGRVYASVRADDLEIEGFLQGEALALGSMRVGRHAQVTADLRASTLSVEPGATIVGSVRIGPREVPEVENLAVPSRAPVSDEISS